MIKESDIATIMEHHLAMNQQLVNMDDSDDDCIAQIIHIMWSLTTSKEKKDYVENIKLLTSKMNSHSHVYHMLNDNSMILGLMPFLQIKYFRPRHTIAHGHLIAHTEDCQ